MLQYVVRGVWSVRRRNCASYTASKLSVSMWTSCWDRPRHRRSHPLQLEHRRLSRSLRRSTSRTRRSARCWPWCRCHPPPRRRWLQLRLSLRPPRHQPLRTCAARQPPRQQQPLPTPRRCRGARTGVLCRWRRHPRRRAPAWSSSWCSSCSAPPTRSVRRRRSTNSYCCSCCASGNAGCSSGRTSSKSSRWRRRTSSRLRRRAPHRHCRPTRRWTHPATRSQPSPPLRTLCALGNAKARQRTCRRSTSCQQHRLQGRWRRRPRRRSRGQWKRRWRTRVVRMAPTKRVLSTHRPLPPLVGSR